MLLPPDDHSHTEWSWDAVNGSMEGSCARAVELGLPSIAFTEHVDIVRWQMRPGDKSAMARGEHGPIAQRMAPHIAPDNRYDAPPLDVEGYLACVERCRARFPTLRILTGVELGEPHWFDERCRRLVATGAFERVLGSLHSVEFDGAITELNGLYRQLPVGDEALELARGYFAELLRMVESSDLFQVLAHIDYPARRWPEWAGPFDHTGFEEEYRAVLLALARSGRALEVNTRLPLDPRVVRWWYELGGEAVSFGSDAHLPSAVGHGFAEAATMVEAQGFRPGRAPHDFWRRAMIG